MMDAHAQLEDFLKRERISFIDVYETMETMGVDDETIANDGPEPFHYVLYGRTGNLLVYVGDRTPENIALMKRWSVLFGDGFTPAFCSPNGGPWFVGMDGETIDHVALFDLGGRVPVKRFEIPEPAVAVGAQLDLFA